MCADINITKNTANTDESSWRKIFSLTGAASFSLLGIPPNVLSVVLILRAKKSKSTTTYFLLNLAIADIANLFSVLLLVILLSTEQRSSNENLRDILRTIVVPPKAIANLTLAMIALERYNGLVRTMKPFLTFSKKRIKVILVALWSICLIIQAPVFIYRLLRQGGSKGLVDVYYNVCNAITYFLPLLVVGFCYGKILKGVYHDRSILGQNAKDPAALAQKKRFVRIMIMVAMIFMLFNLPSVTIKTLKTAGFKISGNDLFGILLLLGCVSSTINPYIYAFQSKKYRKQIRQLFCHRLNVTTMVYNEQSVELQG